MKFKFLLSFLIGGAMFASAQGFKDGIHYYRADMPEEAGIILNNTINDASTDKALANYYLGQVELTNGNTAAAKNYFDKGVSLNPKCGFNYVGLGQIALKEGDKSTAEKYFKEAKNCGKKDAVLLTDVARAYWTVDAVKYKKDVDKWLADATKANMQCPAIYVLQADMIADEDPGKAAALYENAMYFDNQEDYPEAYVKYARTYFKVNPTYSINRLKELLEKQPNSALAQSELAEKYYDNNQLSLATKQYGEYIKNPNHFQKDEQRYVQLLYFNDEYQQSLDLAKDILRRDPNNFYMKRMSLLNLAALQNYDEALAVADDFFKSTNGRFDPIDYITYGNVLRLKGKYPEAAQAYKTLLEIDPSRTPYYKSLAVCYAYSDDPANAAKAMQTYIDNTPDFTAIDLINLSTYLQNSAKDLTGTDRDAVMNKAMDAISKAQEKDPQNPVVTSSLFKLQLAEAGDVLNAQNMATGQKLIQQYEALPELTAANKDDLYRTYYRFAKYYSDNKNTKEAGNYYKKMLGLDPDNQQLRAIVEKNFK